ncbi:hypothetical protein PIB30_076960 [Stylosanthes scabra]|uniref:Uncharacterized protein n=1 Tax=Stylosanthes scabra TaxID=79078 RepID=A0ABU6ZP08_9FABA|nr:hypothetical protein [Stylosanthes scabra]
MVVVETGCRPVEVAEPEYLLNLQLVSGARSQSSSLTTWSKDPLANMGIHIVVYTLSEGRSSNRPALFTGKNYAYCKERMKIFMQAVDYRMWKVVLNGPTIRSKTNTEGNVVPKEEEEK